MENNLIRELKQLKVDIQNGTVTTSGELAKRVLDAFSTSEIGLDLPRYVPSEPPSSIKTNFIIDKIESSIREREYIFDLLLAAAAYEYDEAMKYLDSLEDKVLGLADSVKTLYFYSKPTRSNIHSVAADFTKSLGPFNNPSNTMSQVISSGLTLPVASRSAATGKITLSGNGMSGCWYLLDDTGALLADIDPKSMIDNAIDSDPTTSFEYQRFCITPQQYETTKGYGFGFSDSTLRWANPSYNNIELELKFSFGSPLSCNNVIVQPSVISEKFIIESVSLYLGGVVQRTVEPLNVVVNQELMMHSEGSYVNSASYMFEATTADEILFKLKSTTPHPCIVRHYYAVDADGIRISSESPSVSNPHSYNTIRLSDGERLYEDIPANRYSIGIKDIIAQSITYGVEGVALTQYPIRFGKQIDRIALHSDYEIPSNCSLTFEISFDGHKWYEIKPLGTSIKDQIICLNDMRPSAYQDPSTKYITTEENYDGFYAKISSSRKSGSESLSPIVRSVEFEVMLKE